MSGWRAAQPGSPEVGFTGSYLVLRTPGSALDLAAVCDRTEDLEDEHRYGDWVIAVLLGTDLVEDVEELLEELAEETGAPALTAFVFDSDTADVRGYSEQRGHWCGALPREGMRRVCEDHDDDFDDMFNSAQETAAEAARWADAAELPRSLQKLERAFATDEVELFVSSLLDELWDALGVLPAQ
jgi:hypothetical protein